MILILLSLYNNIQFSDPPYVKDIYIIVLEKSTLEG